jgi:hypothetical protein
MTIVLRLMLFATGLVSFAAFMLVCDAIHIAEEMHGAFSRPAIECALLAPLCMLGMFAGFMGAAR